MASSGINPTNSNGIYARAEETAYVAAEQLHRVFNGTAEEEVMADDGLIPSVRKALVDNFYFLDPIAWEVDVTESVFNQPRVFTNPTAPEDVTYWFAPAATSKQLIPMGGSPFGDDNWQPWINGFDKGNPLISWAYTAETIGQTVINVPFKFKVVGNVFINGVHQNPDEAYEYDKKKRTVTLSQALDLGDTIVIQFGMHGGVVPSLISQLERIKAGAEAAELAAQQEADRAESNADRAEAAAENAAQDATDIIVNNLDAQINSQYLYKNGGEWADAPAQITDADKLTYWTAANGDGYAVKGSVTLPIAKPVTPVNDDNWFIANAVNVTKIRTDSASQLGLVYLADWSKGMKIGNGAMTAKLAVWNNGQFYSVGTDAGFTSNDFADDFAAGRLVSAVAVTINNSIIAIASNHSLSAVEVMLTTDLTVGQRVNTGATTWEVVSSPIIDITSFKVVSSSSALSDFGITGDGVTRETNKCILAFSAIPEGVHVRVPDGTFICIDSPVKVIIATQGQTVISDALISRNAYITVNGRLKDDSWNGSELGKGDYQSVGDVATFYTPLNKDDVVTISTPPFYIKCYLDMDVYQSAFLIQGVGSKCPDIGGNMGGVSFISKANRQVGPTATTWKNGHKIKAIRADDFESTSINYGKPNISGSYFGSTGNIFIDNKTRAGEIGVRLGGDFPHTNVNKFDVVNIYSNIKVKVSAVGSNNTFELCDFSTYNSTHTAPVTNVLASGSNNTFNVYEEGDSVHNVFTAVYAEITTGKYPSNNIYRAKQYQVSNPIINRTYDPLGLNDITKPSYVSGNYPSAVSKDLTVDITANPFLAEINGKVFGSTTNGTHTRTSVASIVGPGYRPRMSETAFTFVFDGVETTYNLQVGIARVNSPEGAYLYPEEINRSLPFSREMINQPITVNWWVYFEGTQEQMEAADITPRLFGNSVNVGVLIPGQWCKLTAMHSYDEDPKVNSNGRVTTELFVRGANNSGLLKGAKLHIGLMTVKMGAITSYKDSNHLIGGAIDYDLSTPRLDDITSQNFVVLQGNYLWADSYGKLRISPTRPASLDSDGVVVGGSNI